MQLNATADSAGASDPSLGADASKGADTLAHTASKHAAELLPVYISCLMLCGKEDEADAAATEALQAR